MKIISGLAAVIGILFVLPVILLVIRSSGEYGNLLFDQFQFYPMFWNSVFYAFIISGVQIVFAVLSAFGMTYVKMKGKHGLFLLYIILMMMPQQVTILPNFIQLRAFHLINTRAGIILPSIFAPFGAVVLYQYMKGMDVLVVEAARLETDSLFRILFQVVLPQIKTSIQAVFVFLFAESYNMLEQSLLFLKDDELKTLSVFISKAEEYGTDIMFPAAVLYMIPVLFLYLLFYHSFQNNLSNGDIV